MVGQASTPSVGVTRVRDVTVVNLIGDHDIVTAPDVRAQMERCAASGDGVVVSLMQTTFLDSGIIRVLFAADKTLRDRDRRLVLHVATASIVARVLDVSGLDRQLACEPSLEKAVALASDRASKD